MERAFRHRYRATLADDMDTTDVEDRGRGKRKKQPPRRVHASDDEESAPPPLKPPKIRKGKCLPRTSLKSCRIVDNLAFRYHLVF